MPEIASNALSAAAAYYSWKSANRTVISRECEWAEVPELTEPEIDALSDANISVIGRWTANVEKYCEKQ